MSVFLPVLLFAAVCITNVQAAPVIALFDPLTLTPSSSLAVPAVPSSMAFGNGSLFAASSAGLARYSSSGTPLATLSPSSFLFSNLAYDDYLYATVALLGTRVISRIIAFDNSSFMLQPVVPLSTMPLALARAGQQTFAAFPSALAQYDAAGQPAALFSTGDSFSFHPLTSFQSLLYAAITGNGGTRLSAIPQLTDLAFTEIVLASLPAVPTALAAGANGIYATFSGGLLHRYGFDGTLLASYSDPNLSFTAAALGPDFLYAAANTIAADVPSALSQMTVG